MILDFSLSHNINTLILLKHGHSNTELQVLKTYILKIKSLISALKSYVKCDISTLIKKTKTM